MTDVDRLLDLARDGATEDLVAAVEGGVAVDTSDPAGNSLLMLAAYHGHVETVRALVGLGADPDLANVNGQTPVGGTIFKGHDDVTRLLLASGADPDAGQPPARQLARMLGRTDLIP